MDLTNLHGYVLDIGHIKENHPSIYDEHVFAFVLLEEKDEWLIEETFQVIGKRITLTILNQVIDADRNAA